MVVADPFVFTFARARTGAIPTEPWYLLAPLSDSGEELRAKVIKTVRALGAISGSFTTDIRIYAFGVGQTISVSDMERGLNPTHTIFDNFDPFTVSGGGQGPLIKMNVPNAVLHTIRIGNEGTIASGGMRIDEVVYEVAIMGARL